MTKNPNQINLKTSAEIRKAGWQAETRDVDGHLCRTHSPFETDEDIVWLVREALEHGETVTIWPNSNVSDTPAPQHNVVGREAVFASRHNDDGECEPVDIDPPKVTELRKKLSGPHPSHVRRFSDASSYDEVCTQCGATDIAGGGWGKLAEPCPSPQKPAATSIEAFEQEFPHHFWHVAKGKVSVGEPLYGALITDHHGIELAHGESDKSANDAFSIAVSAFRAAISASEVENG